MRKEIAIQANRKQSMIAILEDGALAELYIENEENARTIGDIYLGRVRNIIPGIQAAFVDIGQDHDAFLHFSDVGENLPEMLKLVGEEVPAMAAHRLPTRPGKSEDMEVEDEESNAPKPSTNGLSFTPEKLLRPGQKILVKIVKEPIANKGSRVTTDISIAGRFLVLVPQADYVAVSKKITSPKERKRLRTLARSLLPKGFGVIVRTVAEGKDARTLDRDLQLLLEKWYRIEKKLRSNPPVPSLIYQDVNMVSSVVRDLFTEDYDRIIVDNPKLYRNIRSYVQAVAPHLVPNVQLYEAKNGKSLFQALGIDREVEQAFARRVNLPSGGYLIIEHTEAMHVIDINSGRSGKKQSQEETALKVNLEAVREAARQIRLRDLGGIIVIDCIDLRQEENRKKVYHELRKAFQRDRAVYKILPMSDFGLLQITRQRLRPSVTTQMEAPPLETRPPSHDPEVLMEDLHQWLTHYRARTGKKQVTLQAHPFLLAFLKRGLPNRLTQWRLKTGVKVTPESEETLSPLEYRFLDPETQEDITTQYAL